MLKIKLTRIGKKHQPYYRVVVQERRSKSNGDYLANLGHYNPLTHPSTVKLDLDSYRDWLAKGAQPTPTVDRLYQIASGTKAPNIPAAEPGSLKAISK